MKLLLDTHIAVWWVTGNQRLCADARAAIANPSAIVVVSIATVWEIAIKNNLRRPNTVGMGITAAEAVAEFALEQFEVLPIAPRHLAPIERLPHHHGDPFDRLLIAQAQVDGFLLMTHDDALAAYGDHVMVV